MSNVINMQEARARINPERLAEKIITQEMTVFDAAKAICSQQVRDIRLAQAINNGTLPTDDEVSGNE